MLDSYLIQQFDKLSSTQDYAHTLFSTGQAKHGIVISSLDQTHAYGRQKREWISSKGNLAITMILTPQVAVNKFSQLTYVAGIAARDAIASYLPNNKCELKWVNDIMVDGKKICGILLEQVGNNILIGIGVNVVKTPGIEKLNGISLYDLGVNVKLPELLDEILDNFKKYYNNWKEFGFTLTRNKWLENCCGRGEKITVRAIKSELIGVFTNIDESGNLMLETSKGITLVDSGELFFTS